MSKKKPPGKPVQPAQQSTIDWKAELLKFCTSKPKKVLSVLTTDLSGTNKH
jgi:hypothetical protein